MSILPLATLAVVACDSSSETPPAHPVDAGDAGADGGDAGADSGDAFPIHFPGVSENGIFDPSIAADPSADRLWLSYSAVDCLPPDFCVSTRLAYSDDRGASWQEAGLVINAHQDEPSPPAQFAGLPAQWEHEVSNLAYDPAAPAAERWKLIWHRYLKVVDGDPRTDDRKFLYGWIAYKAAGAPEALADAPERNLFAGLGYFADAAAEAYSNGIAGPPEQRLDDLDPELGACLGFTEPGMFATEDTLWVSLMCARADDNDVAHTVLVAWSHPNGPWTYRGTLLVGADARALGADYGTFTATDMFDQGGTAYLLATPIDAITTWYSGCFGFALDLSSGTVQRDGTGGPAPEFFVEGTPGTFNGACTYTSQSVRSGVLYGEASVGVPRGHIYASGLNP